MRMRFPFIVLVLLVLLLAPAVVAQDASTQGSPFSQAKFVPDISFIMDVSALMRNIRDDEYSHLSVPGLEPAEAHGHGHETASEGVNLNYAEIVIASIVDPYFEVFSVLHVSHESTALEEAFLLTRKLPAGLQFKAGKFLSGFGRINDVHPHYWSFSDRPLIHSALFGDEGLNEVGARLTIVPPTDLFLSLGIEVLMGENETSFGREAISDAAGTVSVSPVFGPGLLVGTLKASTDIGETTILAGLSVARGAARHAHDEAGASGTSTILGGDLTILHTFDAVRYLRVQAEYVRREMTGTKYDFPASLPVTISSLERTTDGLYAQAVLKFALRMRAGVRFDLLRSHELTVQGTKTVFPDNLARVTGMAEFNATEFSRLRVQYRYDTSLHEETATGFKQVPVHEVSLQLNLAIGAHGAHSF